MPAPPPDNLFCRRVSETLAMGYRLHGSPAATFDGQTVIVAQALLWPHAVGEDGRLASPGQGPIPDIAVDGGGAHEPIGAAPASTGDRPGRRAVQPPPSALYSVTRLSCSDRRRLISDWLAAYHARCASSTSR